MLDECIMDGKHHERALDYVIMRRQFLKEHDLPESPLRIVRERLSSCGIILCLPDRDVLLSRTDVQLRDLQLLGILSVLTANPHAPEMLALKTFTGHYVWQHAYLGIS